MNITFKKDSGEIYATSPKITLSEELADKLHEFCANRWWEVPEVELYDEELALWFDSEHEPFEFQKYIDRMNQFLKDDLIPAFDKWQVQWLT
jgi:hypothetical protein